MNVKHHAAPRTGGTNWRLIGWGAAAALLMVPLVAMQFTSEVNWDETDFIVMGALLAMVGGALELGVRQSRKGPYRAGFAVAVLGGCLTVWSNLAVGIVGNENDDFNLWFFGVLALGALGALIARFRAQGMALTMLAMAAAQVAVFVLAAVSLTASPWPALFFAPFWLLAAGLFALAARDDR
jgi:hypothetical protein